MSARVKKLHPALKHGGYCATGLLPGEDRTAFERLCQDLIADLRHDGPLENDIVASIARLYWRKQNLDSFRVAESARDRYFAIRSEKVPSTPLPPIDDLSAMFGLEAPDPAKVKAGEEAAKAQARRELGEAYKFVELGPAATIDQMLKDFELEGRLDAMIDKLLKRLICYKEFKSLDSKTSSTPLLRIPGAPKAA
jgi:hypothetical protein